MEGGAAAAVVTYAVYGFVSKDLYIFELEIALFKRSMASDYSSKC